MNIYLPLYFQPSLADSRCKAILDAIRVHPSTKFALIINLHSGPGTVADTKAASVGDAAAGTYAVSTVDLSGFTSYA